MLLCHVLAGHEGESDAWYVGPGDAALIHQQGKDGVAVYDAYGDTYLKRLVSGPLRLSYNPAAGTSRSLSSFVSPVVQDDLQQRLAAEALLKQLKFGKSVRESLQVANQRQRRQPDIVAAAGRCGHSG